MYDQLIKKVINAINSGRVDIAQFHLSNLLLDNQSNLVEDAKIALESAIPGSKIVFGVSVNGIGFRAGYLKYENERYYFA